MPRLLRLLATGTGSILNSRKLAASLGITHPTVLAYTRFLETVFLVVQIPAWRPGIRTREIQAPKVYVADSGLLTYLLGADEERIANDDQVTGKALEDFIVMEVLKHSEWAQEDVRVYHYRHQREEIDLVLETTSGLLGAIEVKAAATVREEDYRAIARLRDARDRAFVGGVVIYTGAQTIPLSDRIWAVPVSGLWVP